MSGTQRTRRAGGGRRLQVLDHVVAMLAVRGFAGTRYLDVSEASGVAVSTLQGYFGSREDMLIEAFQRATTLAVDGMNELVAQVDDPWEQLVAMVDRGLATDAATWRMLMEFWTAAAHDRELQAHAVELANQYREPFRDAVQRGIDSGAFTPRFSAESIVEATVASIVGLLYPVVLGHLTPENTDYREAVLTQLAFVLTADVDTIARTTPAPSRKGRST